MHTTAATLTDSVAAITRFGVDPSALRALVDDDLIAAARSIAAAQTHLDAYAGSVAAEIAHRSRREFGHGGLAQRTGFRTAEAMIQQVAGSTRADAVAMVNIGTLLAETASSDSMSPGADGEADQSAGTETAWLGLLGREVADGALTFARAEAIRAGLDECSDSISAPVLADGVRLLIEAATSPDAPASADQLRRLARQLREGLDTDALATREDLQRDAQYLKTWTRADGMLAGTLLLDKENGAYLRAVIDQIASPRRGGPRFTGGPDADRAARLADDSRSTERIVVESMLELIRIGADADTGAVLGSREPAVRIVVTRESLDGTTPGGIGRIESTGEIVSLATVERHVCQTGFVAVSMTPSGQPLDVGREQRLFTRRQRIALAVRDGGCMFPRCDRPPSWTEAHHVAHWHEDAGPTNIADGISLCRHHHLLLHNNGWKVIRDGSSYFLKPPISEDPAQALLPLSSKSPLMHELGRGGA